MCSTIDIMPNARWPIGRMRRAIRALNIRAKDIRWTLKLSDAVLRIIRDYRHLRRTANIIHEIVAQGHAEPHPRQVRYALRAVGVTASRGPEKGLVDPIEAARLYERGRDPLMTIRGAARVLGTVSHVTLSRRLKGVPGVTVNGVKMYKFSQIQGVARR